MATNDCLTEKQLIVNNLLQTVKQCQIRFGGRSELATDLDQRVVKLCQALESALSHGLRKNRNLVNYTRKLLMNGIISHGFSHQMSETNVCFWHFVGLHLTRHEFDRYLLLRNVRTDIGRGKAWLRSALNEHSLERYVLSILSDSLTLRNHFYEENAFIRDEEINSVLPTISRGLNSILFAINIDNPEFDISDTNSKAIDISHPSDPLPVICRSSPNAVNISAVRSRRRHRINVISLSDDEDQSVRSVGARSLPNTCVSSPDSVFPQNNFNAIYETYKESSSAKSKADSQVFPIGAESVDTNVVLTPIGAENLNSIELIIDDNISDSEKLSFNVNKDLMKSELSLESNADKEVTEELDKIKAEMNCLKQRFEEKVQKLETNNENLQKDNNLLQIQIKKYLAAISLLRYSSKQDIESLPNTSEDSLSQKMVELQNESYLNELNEYEKKLVEVAEMHAELVEFNQHLHRVIRQKDALISRLKEELVDLRGPLPEVSEAAEDLMSISSDFETDLSIQSTIQPLIHVWIPTVFLSSGQKSKAHHIYQIYVRIREDEWNVYRRYSQFHSLHKTLRKKLQVLNTFDFPPKKTIGNRDSKVVQERRKKLEHYLRNLLNVLQSQHNISDKQRLIDILPFLSERYVESDGRSRSESQLNATNASQHYSQHYMGL